MYDRLATVLGTLAMQIDRSQIDRKFRRRWALASTVGWFVGFLVGFVAAGSLEPLVGFGPLQGLLAYFILGVCTGAGVGLMQWLVLRRRVFRSGWWILAGTVGVGVAGGAGYGAAVLAFGYSEGLEDLGSFAAVWGWTAAAALGGALTGILQWCVLRRHVRRAGWWLSASTLGWAVSMAVAGTIWLVGYQGVTEPPQILYSALLLLGGLVAGGIVLGAVTGAALVWLLMQPVPPVPSSIDGCD